MPVYIFLSAQASCHTTTCMKPSIIVWDLETVPDLGGFAAANASYTNRPLKMTTMQSASSKSSSRSSLRSSCARRVR
jgi:hypothetical protein